MSDPNGERISVEELAIRTGDGLSRDASTGLSLDSQQTFWEGIHGYAAVKLAEFATAETTSVEPVASVEHARLSDEEIDAAYAKLEVAREAHPDIHRPRMEVECARETDLPKHRPGYTMRIPTRVPRAHMQPSVDELLGPLSGMPHMKSGDEVKISEIAKPAETVEPEVFSEETQEFVQSLLARWRGMTQLKREQGRGRVRQFFAAGFDALGLDRDLHDEAVTAKAVEVDRVLQIAAQMIANGQDVSKLAAKYPAVKDLGRFLRTLEYDAPPSHSRVYSDSEDHVFGGRVEATTNPTVVLDGESMDWVAAQDELDAEMLRITDKYATDKEVVEVK